MKVTMPHLNIEILSTGIVRLENESMNGDCFAVELHPMHLRYIAEKLGLVREMSASEADALRMVDKLARRLKLLAERIDRLDDYLLNCSDHKHADLEWEVQYSRATCELSDEFVRELAESRAVVTPMSREQRDQGSAGSQSSAIAIKAQRATSAAQLELTA